MDSSELSDSDIHEEGEKDTEEDSQEDEEHNSAESSAGNSESDFNTFRSGLLLHLTFTSHNKTKLQSYLVSSNMEEKFKLFTLTANNWSIHIKSKAKYSLCCKKSSNLSYKNQKPQ